MDSDTRVAVIAERLALSGRADGFAPLLVVLLRKLAAGRPVSHEALSTALGWPVARVATVLGRSPDTEYDDHGDVVGHGLTLRETRHSFEVNGHRLYTWCALDALMFPALLGKVARVVSRCPVTATPVSLTASPEAVSELRPSSAAVSLVIPDGSLDIRSSFCCQVHLFVSISVGQRWAQSRKGTQIVSVEEAFRVGRAIVAQIIAAARARGRPSV